MKNSIIYNLLIAVTAIINITSLDAQENCALRIDGITVTCDPGTGPYYEAEICYSWENAEAGDGVYIDFDHEPILLDDTDIIAGSSGSNCVTVSIWYSEPNCNYFVFTPEIGPVEIRSSNPEFYLTIGEYSNCESSLKLFNPGCDPICVIPDIDFQIVCTNSETGEEAGEGEYFVEVIVNSVGSDTNGDNSIDIFRFDSPNLSGAGTFYIGPYAIDENDNSVGIPYQNNGENCCTGYVRVDQMVCGYEVDPDGNSDGNSDDDIHISGPGCDCDGDEKGYIIAQEDDGAEIEGDDSVHTYYFLLDNLGRLVACSENGFFEDLDNGTYEVTAINLFENSLDDDFQSTFIKGLPFPILSDDVCYEECGSVEYTLACDCPCDPEMVSVNDPIVCVGETSAALTLNGTTPSDIALDYDMTAESQSFSDVATTSTIPTSFVIPSGAAPGTYSGVMNYTDANGCPGTDTFTLIVNAAPSLEDNSICVSSRVFLNGSGDPNSTDPYVSSDPSIAEIGTSGLGEGEVWGRAPGQATITYTDANGCQATAIITVHPVPTISLSSINPSCGEADGSIEFTFTDVPDGLVDITYLQSQSLQTFVGVNVANGLATVTGLTAGNYENFQVIINGCTSAGLPDVSLVDIEGPSCTVSITNTSCDENNGIANVSVTGGVSPYTYDWSNGITTATNPNLAAGTYTVTVTDANNCMTICSGTIVAGTELSEVPTASPISYCVDDMAAILTATSTGTLNWYTAATGGMAISAPTPSTAVAGVTTYYVSQTIGGCESERVSLVVTVNENPPINTGAFIRACEVPFESFMGDFNLADAEDVANGDVDGDGMDGSSSTVTYYASMADAIACMNPLNNGMDLPPADIYAKVESPNGCSQVVLVKIELFRAADFSVNATASTKCDPVNGSITFSGLTPSSGFALDYNDPSGSMVNLVISTDANGEYQLTGLAPGTYNMVIVSVQPNLGSGLTCPGPSFDVTILGPEAPVVTLTNDGPVCAGSEATFTAGGGSMYEYFNDADDDNEIDGGESLGAVSATSTYVSSSLNDGDEIHVLVTDANGCTAVTSSVISTKNVPTLSATSINPMTCGNSDGSITLTLTDVPDGTYTINYLDAVAAAQTFTNVMVSGGSATISGLPQGTYNAISITVNGCTSSTDVDIILSDPGLPNPPTTNSVSYCVGDVASTLTATGTGTLNWYTVSTGGTALISAPTPSTVSAGVTTYYVSQTIAGCESARASLSVAVFDIPTLSAFGNNPSACGATDGSITLTQMDVPDGTYTISYEDASGTGQTFTGVVVTSGMATITGLSAGMYNNLTIMVHECASVEDVDILLTHDCAMDVAIQKMVSSAGPYKIGDKVNFTIIVYNQGVDPVYNVTVVDYLPGELDFFMADNSSNDFSLNPDTGGGGTITTTIAATSPIAGGASYTINLVLTVNSTAIPDSTIQNDAEITNATSDADGNNPIVDEDDDLNSTGGNMEDDNNIDDNAIDDPNDQDDFDFARIRMCGPNCGTFPWDGSK